MIADDDNSYAIKGTELGTTDATTGYLNVRVKIYLEGWQKLSDGTENGTSNLWEPSKYIGNKFNVGMRFTCEAHKANE